MKIKSKSFHNKTNALVKNNNDFIIEIDLTDKHIYLVIQMFTN